MKVLLVATVQSHICQFHRPLVKVLHQFGAEVHIAARNNLAEKNGLTLDFADKVFDIPFSRSPKSRDNIIAYKQLKKIINNDNYDVVHCNTPMGGIVARLAARKARKKGTKVFYTAHGFHFYKGAPMKNWLIFYPIEKFFAHRFTDKLITIAKEDYELAKANFKTDVYHIHGAGVDKKKYLSVPEDKVVAFSKEKGYDGRFVILCTGELNKNKNQSMLINAMPIILRECPNALLLLAGNGPEEKNLASLINVLNLNDSVKLLGYCTDLENYINVSDLVVSVSKREGLGLNIIEAMLCGKAVVASNNRGHSELIINNKTGIVLSEYSVNSLASEIIKLINNTELKREFENTAKTAVQPYLCENVEEELKGIYQL